ncbi:hypothetical protein CERSUDRAFT_103745 [Gelatoporia subvermispora B]|uniref:BTB domain-containing protein n=1 Tax=Ceriporiopsis subvermispora (strain B) TaxID=914234 RepID=M2RMU7_CERS8|nr:hypothetical protein CERSUDRAFT_103745 [Gelatoporia subvermispora B]
MSVVDSEEGQPVLRSPSRKRARVENEDELHVLHELQSSQQIDTVRDDTYYLPDGSCILQVENTLFNVHRTILSKDASSFSAMFDMPEHPAHQVEGKSDENPIVLTGDSVQEFKNFLWVLYALPHELVQISTIHTDISRLIDIARVSNKYSYKSVETWALDVLDDYINRRPPPLIPPHDTPDFDQVVAEKGAEVSHIMRLAHQCGHERLLASMIATLRKLMGVSIRYAHLAMTLADELDLRVLRGAAYLEVMQKTEVVAHLNAGSAVESFGADTVDDRGRLVVTREQRLRLLCGYHRLTVDWERLRTRPLSFPHAATCGTSWHQSQCAQSWLDFWKEKTICETVLSLGLADVIGRLRVIARECERWGTATYMHHECRMIARKAIQDKIKEIEEVLPDYFVEGSI